jgi:dihydroflavonol-4-reductase
MNLITGGTGFLGSHLAALLLKKREEVSIFKRASGNTVETELIFRYHFGEESHHYLKKISFIPGNITEASSLKKAMPGVKHVYHCAAVVSFYRKDLVAMQEINVRGTETLINVLADYPIEKLCHVSSTAALGKSSNDNLINEQTMWEDHGYNSAYAISKYQAELEVWRGIAEGLPVVIVQPGIILGPGLWTKGTCKLFTLVDKGLKFFTRGINGYVDAEDVAEVMTRLTQGNFTNDRFLLVSENLSYENLLSMIARSLGKNPPGIHAGFYARKLLVLADAIRAGITGNPVTYSNDFARVAGSVSRYDASKIQDALNYRFKPVNDTIRQTGQFYQNVKAYE